MILFLACTPDPVDLGDRVPTGPDPTVAVPFVEPAVAEDLDPDPGIVRIALTASPRTYIVGGRTVDGYAYDGQNPGPTIRATLGDTLVVTLTNALPVETTIHWHGLSVPYAMDGVPWQADPVGPGETFVYTFPLTQAGTFWYHPHFDSDRQVDLGLYGMLVVADPADPPVDRDLALVFDDWTEAAPATNVHALPPFPGEWAVNGIVRPQLRLNGGELVRARIVNASNTRYLDLGAVPAIAHDQGLLPSLREEPLVLGPGDRADLAWRVGEEAPVLATSPYTPAGGPAVGEIVPLVDVEIDGPAPAPDAPAWPFDPEPPSADPGTTDITYVFAGDGDQWLINGEQFPDVTIEALALGQVAVIELRNLSAAEHPFHLHGMPFEVLAIDGEAPGYRRIEDTLNVRIGAAARLLVRADNAGEWMAHCHILPHAHQGMMTLLRVE